MAGETQDPNKRLAILAGLTMIAITAVQFVAARFSLRHDLTAIDIATLRFLGAGAVFLPIAWYSGLGKLRALGSRRALALALLVGLPYPIIINWGLTYAPATHAAALCPASIVFFSFLLSRAFFKERVSPVQIMSIAVLITGLVLLSKFKTRLQRAVQVRVPRLQLAKKPKSPKTREVVSTFELLNRFVLQLSNMSIELRFKFLFLKAASPVRSGALP